jgi:hypothetical protein
MNTKIGVREFRTHLPSYLVTSSPIAITRHGHIIGYYIPTHQEATDDALNALKQAAAKLDIMLTEFGVAEDDILNDFKSYRAAKA